MTTKTKVNLVLRNSFVPRENPKAFLRYTFEEAAQTIEREGKLITMKLLDDNGDRCALGVLGEFNKSNDGWMEGARADNGYVEIIEELISVNNSFEGTLEERAVHVAAWLRGQA